MNISDLNDDIMSKIKHNLFLKSLMKHRNSFIDCIDWDCWDYENYYDCFSLDDGVWAFSTPRKKYDGVNDFKLSNVHLVKHLKSRKSRALRNALFVQRRR